MFVSTHLMYGFGALVDNSFVKKRPINSEYGDPRLQNLLDGKIKRTKEDGADDF